MMKFRYIPPFLLGLYTAFLIKLLILKTVAFRIGHLRFDFSGTESGPANLVPFKTILPYLLGKKGFVIALFELVGNIALLVPIGFLFPFVWKRTTWKEAFILAVLFPFLIEITQLISQVGIFDIDDIILNAVGILIGYSFYVFIKHVSRRGEA